MSLLFFVSYFTEKMPRFKVVVVDVASKAVLSSLVAGVEAIVTVMQAFS